MFGWIFGKKLEDVLNATEKIRVRGVRFTIQKIDVLAHLNGSAVLLQSYDTYKTKGEVDADGGGDMKADKARKHMSEVLVAGVVEPKLSFKPEVGCIEVEKIFKDMDIANELYTRVMAFTYGKKKLKQLISQGTKLSKSTP